MIKKEIFIKASTILFWLFSLNLCSQNNIVVSTEFKELEIGKSLFYLEDVENTMTPEVIENKEFSPLPSSFTGKQSVKIWYRLKLTNTSLKELRLVCRIHTISFNYLKLYKKEKGVLKEIFKYTELQNKNIEIPFSMIAGEESTFYAEVFFRKSIYFPIKIAEVDQNANTNIKLNILLGLFYGFAIIVFLINILFYINTKNLFFLFYCFLLLSTTLILFELDNGFYVLFGNSSYIKHIDLCLHISLAIAVLLFTGKAILINTYYSKLKYIGIGLIITNIVFYVLYVITDELFWYSTGTSINIVILLIYGIAAITLFKKESYARFLVIGYSVFLVFSLLYDFPVQYGMLDIGITEWLLKIGALLEMIVFLYAISYRHKKVEAEKEIINEKLQKQLESQKLIRLENEEFRIELKEIKEDQKKKDLQGKRMYLEFSKKYELTPRESDIGELLLKGYSNKEIAGHLEIKITTIKHHTTSIFVKLDIVKRADFLNVYMGFKRNKAVLLEKQ